MAAGDADVAEGVGLFPIHCRVQPTGRARGCGMGGQGTPLRAENRNSRTEGAAKMRTTIVVSVALAAVVGLMLFDAAPAEAARGGRFVASKVPSRSVQPRMHKPAY